MSKSRLSSDELYQIYTATWQNIAREDDNIASRIGWAIGLSTGLFTAIAFMVPNINNVCNGIYWPPMVCILISSLSFLGLYFCSKTRMGVDAAHNQISYLRDQYSHLADNFKDLCLPRPFGDSGQSAGRKSSGIYPIALLFFWSAILAVSAAATAWTFVMAVAFPHEATCQATANSNGTACAIRTAQLPAAQIPAAQLPAAQLPATQPQAAPASRPTPPPSAVAR